LTLDVPPGLPRIAGDGDRLAQVFTNLLDNAVTHTPPGGQIALRAGTNHDGVTITVQDTGEGIPAADLPRIFERFYQVDKSRKNDRRSGIGLGLAITKQIVESHGGAIHVTSQPGQGTTFTVWLPFLAPDVTTVAARGVCAGACQIVGPLLSFGNHSSSRKKALSSEPKRAWR
jgi:signal transduction histidine kinase